MKHKTLISDTR